MADGASLRGGAWKRSQFAGVEVREKTLGVVGLGNVGSEVARRGKGLDMNVVAYDPFVSPERAQQLGVELVDSLDDVIRRADFLTLHTKLTAETRHQIAGAGPLPQQHRDGAQRSVAALMPVPVVDRLEVVEVDRKQRPGHVRVRRTGEPRRDFRLEGAAVEQPGQGIGARGPHQRRLGSRLRQGDAELLGRFRIQDPERLISNADNIDFIDTSRSDRIVLNFSGKDRSVRQEQKQGSGVRGQGSGKKP